MVSDHAAALLGAAPRCTTARSSRVRGRLPRAAVAFLFAAVLVLPTAHADPAGTHVVQTGETLSDIAQAAGTTVDALLAANNLTDPNLIAVGDVLVIPSTPALAAAAPSSSAPPAQAATALPTGTPVPTTLPQPGPSSVGSIYLVRVSDDLWSIARTHGTTVSALQQANHLANGDSLTVGMQLMVPPSAPSVAAAASPSPTPKSVGFARPPIVTLDPGHGGDQVGTSHTFPDGTVLQEKALTLRVASRLHDVLVQAGYTVIQTRTTDDQVGFFNGQPSVPTGPETLDSDLQSRIDIANAAHSDLLVSLHFDGDADPGIKGTFVLYDPDRPFTSHNQALAQTMDAGIIQSLEVAGYTTDNHGPTPDTQQLGGDHYYLLGPQSDTIQRPSLMPAVISEPLFLTNDQDATALLNDAVVSSLVQGYYGGIVAYFKQYPPT